MRPTSAVTQAARPGRPSAVAGMVVFTWLTIAGLDRLKLEALERVESGVLGGLLCLLGFMVMVFEQ